MPNSIWNDGEPTESTTLLGQDAHNNDHEHASGSNMGWPSAASDAPLDATTLWGSPSQQDDDAFDSGTDADTVSSTEWSGLPA
eukprot:8053454-Pyramimonas_sp.AAC.1